MSVNEIDHLKNNPVCHLANIILLFYLLFYIVSLFYLTKVSLGCTANKTRFPIVTHVIYSTTIEENND